LRERLAREFEHGVIVIDPCHLMVQGFARGAVERLGHPHALADERKSRCPDPAQSGFFCVLFRTNIVTNNTH